MKWITRKNVKVYCVACPWLIRRFVDSEAEFLFVNEQELLEAARTERAIPFDAPKIPEVKLNHRGNMCSFRSHHCRFQPAGSRLGTACPDSSGSRCQGSGGNRARGIRIACNRRRLRGDGVIR